MYLRATPRQNKDGSVVRYLQLAHNVWDSAAKRSKVQVVYNFGREDQANRAALERLVATVPGPGSGTGRHRRRGTEVHRVASAGRDLGVGWAVAGGLGSTRP